MRSCKALALLAVTSMLAACGGGATSPVAPAKAASPSQSNARTATVTVRFQKPAAKSKAVLTRHGKTRDYVSPATSGAIVTAVSVGSAGAAATPGDDATYDYDLSSDCTTAGSCSITFPLAPDTYAITVAAYDAAQTTGETAPAGTELSTDTETYAVATNANNQFDFYLLALVEGFYVAPAGGSETRADHYFGADGAALSTPDAVVETKHRADDPTAEQTPQPIGTAVYEALDPDGYPIDQYGGLYGWALAGPTPSATNGPAAFYAVATDNGDTTGCGPARGCFTANNDRATAAPQPSSSPSTAPIFYPNGGGPAPFASPAATASSLDETFAFTYVSGGGPGAGIEAWTTASGIPGGAETPYYGTLTIPNVAGSTFAGSFTIPYAYVVPLYAYVTDGNGNAAGGTSDPGGSFYVWAAQYAPPDGQSLAGASYAVTIPAGASCEDANGNELATVSTAPVSANVTYYPGYGKVFEVDASGGSAGSCLIDVSDGVDTVTYDAYVGTPNPSSARTAPAHSKKR